MVKVGQFIWVQYTIMQKHWLGMKSKANRRRPWEKPLNAFWLQKEIDNYDGIVIVCSKLSIIPLSWHTELQTKTDTCYHIHYLPASFSDAVDKKQNILYLTQIFLCAWRFCLCVNFCPHEKHSWRCILRWLSTWSR